MNNPTIFNSQLEADNHSKEKDLYEVTEFENCHFNFPYEFGLLVTDTVRFKKCQFIVDQFFDSIKFQSKVIFIECEFHGTISFDECTFEQKMDFHNSIVHKTASFSEVVFEEKFNGWNVTFHEGVSFAWANFRKRANLSHMKVLSGRAYFYGATFDANLYLNDANINRLDLDRSIIDKGFFLKTKIRIAERETFRIIKNEFLKQNDRIEALKYHRREMSAYWKELIDSLRISKTKVKSVFKFKWLKSIFKSQWLKSKLKHLWDCLKSIGDLVILSLNAISNGFGLWWPIGVVFTFLTTLGMYYWYLDYVCVCPPGELSFWKYYPQFLSPIHKIDFIENATLKDGAYVIDFVGRAVSSFGIYQTVQAFRKFGRF